MSARRRLGLDGRWPTVIPVRPLPMREPYSIPYERYRFSPGSHVGLARRTAEPATAVAVPYRRGRPPGTRVPPGERDPYKREVERQPYRREVAA
ncbi:hypothetical protein AB0B89_16025 [Sphaerisporangium sp. NPDC049002]|uniref:hypothetical protein n=1 Tax=unclassified Sphaerisporangium TaxID=2630420 RepID=UPI0033E34991